LEFFDNIQKIQIIFFKPIVNYFFGNGVAISKYSTGVDHSAPGSFPITLTFGRKGKTTFL
jgi:hypothetical protein